MATETNIQESVCLKKGEKEENALTSESFEEKVTELPGNKVKQLETSRQVAETVNTPLETGDQPTAESGTFFQALSVPVVVADEHSNTPESCKAAKQTEPEEETEDKSVDAQEASEQCENGSKDKEEQKSEESVKKIEQDEEIEEIKPDVEMEKQEQNGLLQAINSDACISTQTKSQVEIIEHEQKDEDEKKQDVNFLEKDQNEDDITSAQEVTFEGDLQEKNHHSSGNEHEVVEAKEGVKEDTDVCVSTQTELVKESIKNEEQNDEKAIEKELCEETGPKKAEFEGGLEIYDSVAPIQKGTLNMLEKDQGDSDGVTSSQEAPCVYVEETTTVQHVTTVIDFKEQDLNEKPGEFIKEETEDKSLDAQQASKECENGANEEIEPFKKNEKEEENEEIKPGVEIGEKKEVCEETGSEKVEYEKEVKDSAIETITKDENEDEEKEKEVNMLEKDEGEDDGTSAQAVTFEKDLPEKNHPNEDDERELVIAEESIEKDTEVIRSSENTEQNSIPSDVCISTQTEPEEESTEKKDEEAIERDDGQTNENVSEKTESEEGLKLSDSSGMALNENETVRKDEDQGKEPVSEEGESGGDDVTSSENAPNKDIKETVIGQHDTTVAYFETGQDPSATHRKIHIKEAEDKSVDAQEETEQYDDRASDETEKKLEQSVNETAHSYPTNEQEENTKEIKPSVETIEEKDICISTQIKSQEEATKNEGNATESDGDRKEKLDDAFVKEVCEENDLKKTESEEEKEDTNDNTTKEEKSTLEHEPIEEHNGQDEVSKEKIADINETTKVEPQEDSTHSSSLESSTEDTSNSLKEKAEIENLPIKDLETVSEVQIPELVPKLEDSMLKEECFVLETEAHLDEQKETVTKEIISDEKTEVQGGGDDVTSSQNASNEDIQETMTGQHDTIVAYVEEGQGVSATPKEILIKEAEGKSIDAEEVIHMSLELGQPDEHNVEETHSLSKTVSENPEDEIKKEDKDASLESVEVTNDDTTKEEIYKLEQEPVEVHSGQDEVSTQKVTDLNETTEVDPQEDVSPSTSLETSTEDTSNSEKEKAEIENLPIEDLEIVSEVQIPELVPKFEESVLKEECFVSETESHLDEEKGTITKEISSDEMQKIEQATKIKQETVKEVCEETSSEKAEFEEGLKLSDSSDMKRNKEGITTFKDEDQEKDHEVDMSAQSQCEDNITSSQNEVSEEKEDLHEKNDQNEGNERDFTKHGEGIDEDTEEIKSSVETKENTEHVIATNICSSTQIETNEAIENEVTNGEKATENDNEIVSREENLDKKQEDVEETKMGEQASTVAYYEEGQSLGTITKEVLDKEEKEEDKSVVVAQEETEQYDDGANDGKEQKQEEHTNEIKTGVETNEEKDVCISTQNESQEEATNNEEHAIEENDLKKTESEEERQLSDSSNVQTRESVDEDIEETKSSDERKENMEQQGLLQVITADVCSSTQTQTEYTEKTTEGEEKTEEETIENDDVQTEKPESPLVATVCEARSSEMVESEEGVKDSASFSMTLNENESLSKEEKLEKEHEIQTSAVQGGGDNVTISHNASNEDKKEATVGQHDTIVAYVEEGQSVSEMPKEILIEEAEDKSIDTEVVIHKTKETVKEECEETSSEKVEFGEGLKLSGSSNVKINEKGITGFQDDDQEKDQEVNISVESQGEENIKSSQNEVSEENKDLQEKNHHNEGDFIKSGEGVEEDTEEVKSSVETKENTEHVITIDVCSSTQIEPDENFIENEEKNGEKAIENDQLEIVSKEENLKKKKEDVCSLAQTKPKEETIYKEAKSEEAIENDDGQTNLENQEKEQELEISEIQGGGDDVISSQNTSNEDTKETAIDQHANTMAHFEEGLGVNAITKELIREEVDDKSIHAQEGSEQSENGAKDEIEQQPEESVNKPVNSCSETIEGSIKEEEADARNKEIESKLEAENQGDITVDRSEMKDEAFLTEKVTEELRQTKEQNVEEIQACLTETVSEKTEDKITKGEDLPHETIEHINENVNKEEKCVPDEITKEIEVSKLEHEPVEEQNDSQAEVSKEKFIDLNQTTAVEPREDVMPSGSLGTSTEDAPNSDKAKAENENLPIEDLESVTEVHIPEVKPRSEDSKMKEKCLISASATYVDEENGTVTKENLSDENLETLGSTQQPENSYSTTEENVTQLEQVGEINSLYENKDMKEDVTQESHLSSTEDCSEMVKDIILTEEIEQVPLEIEKEKGINDFNEQIVEEDSHSAEAEEKSAQNQKETIHEISNSDSIPVENPEVAEVIADGQIGQEDLQGKEDISRVSKVTNEVDQEPKEERIPSLEDPTTVESPVDLSNKESTAYSSKVTKVKEECILLATAEHTDDNNVEEQDTKTNEISSATNTEQENVMEAPTKCDEAKSSDLIIEEKALTKENLEVHGELKPTPEPMIKEDQVTIETKPQPEQSDITSENITSDQTLESKLEHTSRKNLEDGKEDKEEVVTLEPENEIKNIENQNETTKNIILTDEVAVEMEKENERNNTSTLNQKELANEIEYSKTILVGSTEVTEVKDVKDAKSGNEAVEDVIINEVLLEDEKAKESKSIKDVINEEAKLNQLTSDTNEVCQIERSSSKPDELLEAKDSVENTKEPKFMADNLNVMDETCSAVKGPNEADEIIASEFEKLENTVTEENIIKADADKEKVTLDEPQADDSAKTTYDSIMSSTEQDVVARSEENRGHGDMLTLEEKPTEDSEIATEVAEIVPVCREACATDVKTREQRELVHRGSQEPSEDDTLLSQNDKNSEDPEVLPSVEKDVIEGVDKRLEGALVIDVQKHEKDLDHETEVRIADVGSNVECSEIEPPHLDTKEATSEFIKQENQREQTKADESIEAVIPVEDVKTLTREPEVRSVDLEVPSVMDATADKTNNKTVEVLEAEKILLKDDEQLKSACDQSKPVEEGSGMKQEPLEVNAPGTLDTAATEDLKISQKYVTDDLIKVSQTHPEIQKYEVPASTVDNQQSPNEPHPKESTESKILTEKIYSSHEQGEPIAKSLITEETMKTNKASGTEPQCSDKASGTEPQCSDTVFIDQKEKSESVEPSKFKMADVLHEPAKGNSEVAENLIGERDLDLTKDQQVEKEETGESGVKTDEEDEEEDNEDDEKMGSCSDAPVMVEASKDMDVKVHKKSHNILSGVGSKVKHSIAKVKKAISGKSPPKSAKNQVIG